MAEPTTVTVGTVAAAAGIITLTGSVFGLHYDALLIGLFGGLISLMHVSAGSKVRTAGTLASAAVCAAVLSPIAFPIYSALDWLPKVPMDSIRIPAAFLIGLGSQVGVPLALEYLAGFMRARTPRPPVE